MLNKKGLCLFCLTGLINNLINNIIKKIGEGMRFCEINKKR